MNKETKEKLEHVKNEARAIKSKIGSLITQAQELRNRDLYRLEERIKWIEEENK